MSEQIFGVLDWAWSNLLQLNFLILAANPILKFVRKFYKPKLQNLAPRFQKISASLYGYFA